VWFPLFSKYCSTAKCFDSHGPREKTKPDQFPSAASVLGGDEGKDCEDVESTAAGSETSDTWCTLCLLVKVLAEMKDKSRCKLCDSLRLRIFRICGEDGKSSLDTFADISKEARATFYRENVHKFKDELRKQIETTVKQISTNSVEFGWVGTGDLMDSPDLVKKYEHNPIRVKAIKMKARQVICPSTGIRMYEDLKIVTHTGESNKRAREESDTISQHRSERVAAKKKPGKVTKADTDQTDDKHMSEAQLKTLGAMKEWYTQGVASLLKFDTDVETYDEHVPKTVKTRLGEAKETVDLALAELNVVIEQAEFTQLGQNQKETKKELAALETKLKTLLKDVKPKSTDEANPEAKAKGKEKAKGKR
jgi:hypothetical protein